MVAPIRTGQAQTAAPSTVTGPTNAEGSSQSFARADHQHRLEVALQDGGAAVGSRPTVNFTGAGVTVTDDGGNDRINVDIPGSSGALAGLPGNIYANLVAYVDPADRNSYPGSGTTVTDIEGNLSAGTLAGGVAFADGAFRFTGSAGEQLSFTKNANTDNVFNGGGTIVMVVRMREVSTGNRILATTQNASGAAGWRLRLQQGAGGGYSVFFARATTSVSGQWRTFDQVSDLDPLPRQDYAGARPIRNGAVLVIAVTYNDDSTANDPTIYVNGQPFITGDGLDQLNNPTGSFESDNPNPLQIGYNLFSDSEPQGDLCPFLMFDRELTPIEIAQITNVFAGARAGSQIGRLGEGPSPAAAGQKVTIRAGAVPDGAGVAAGGTLAILGGDVQSNAVSDAGDVLLRGGDKTQGTGSGGAVEVRGGYSEGGAGGAVDVSAGESRSGTTGPNLTLAGGDNTETGDAGRTIVRAGDATAAGSTNNNGGSISMRSGGYREGIGGGPATAGAVYMRSGGPLVSGAGGGETGDITIYTGRDAVAGDVSEDFAGASCDTGSITITTQGAGASAPNAGDISVICGDTTSNNGDPGDLLCEAGDNLTTGPTVANVDGGTVTINAGDSSATGASGSGSGGDVSINGGDQTGAANEGGRGGDVLVTGGDTAGNEDAGRGGDIELQTGATGTGARDGELRMLTPSTEGRHRVRTGGFADSSLDTITVGEQVTLGIGATDDLYQTPAVTVDGDGVKVIAYVDAIDSTTPTEVVSTKIEQSFYRSGGTLVALTAHQNNEVSNGAAWGTDGSLSLVISGDSVIVRLTNGSGSTGYTVNVSGYVTFQKLVQS